MNEETLKAITEIANKLGTTSEYLWHVLIRQAPISGTIDLITMAILAYVSFSLFRFVRQKTSKDDEDYQQWNDEIFIFLAWFGVFIVCSFTAIVILSSISTTFSAFFNPEYWALKQIIGRS